MLDLEHATSRCNGLSGMHFLATIAVTVAVWILDVFEEYIVGLMLLLAWIVLGIVPSKVALAGVSENSWFFTVGSLGVAAANWPDRTSTPLSASVVLLDPD